MLPWGLVYGHEIHNIGKSDKTLFKKSLSWPIQLFRAAETENDCVCSVASQAGCPFDLITMSLSSVPM